MKKRRTTRRASCITSYVFKSLIFTRVRVDVSKAVLVSTFELSILDIIVYCFNVPKVYFSAYGFQFPYLNRYRDVHNMMLTFQPQSKVREIVYGGEDIVGGDGELHTLVHSPMNICTYFQQNLVSYYPSDPPPISL